MRQRIMAKINQSAGVLNQARDAVARIAQLEEQRRFHLSRGWFDNAGRTLQGMADAFAAAPTMSELRNTLKEYVPNGQMISGRAYHDYLTTHGMATYSLTSQSPEQLNEHVRVANLRWITDGRTQTKVPEFVRSGVQAAAYHYATRQERMVGSGLGAAVPMSTADRAITLHQAKQRADYLTAAAAFAGLGAGTDAALDAQALAQQAELCRRLPDSPSCKKAKEEAKASGIDFGKILDDIKNMKPEDAKKHVDWWVFGTLNNWFWAGKKDVVWAFCSTPDWIREWKLSDNSQPFIDAFKKKAKNSGWAWDSDWKCGSASSASSTADKYKSYIAASQQMKQQETAKEESAKEESSSNTALILGGAALVAIVFLAARK